MNEEHKSEAVEHVAEAASHAIEAAEKRAEAAEVAAAAIADSARESEHGKRFERLEGEVAKWHETHAGISSELSELRKATSEMATSLHELRGREQAAVAATLEPATLSIPLASKQEATGSTEAEPPIAEANQKPSEDTEGALHPAEAEKPRRPRIRWL